MELKDEADVAIAEARERSVREARHIGVAQRDRSLVGAQQGAHDLEQGGFSGAGSADYAHHLAAGDVGVDAFQHFECAK